MGYDEAAFESLIEQSQDLHEDSMRQVHSSIEDLAEINQDLPTSPERRRWLGRGAKVGAAVAAGSILAPVVGGSRAFAQTGASSVNVQALQTSASLENLAVATYGKLRPIRTRS